MDHKSSYGYVDYADTRSTDFRETIEFIQEGREDYRYRVGTTLSYKILGNYRCLSDLSLKIDYNFIEVDSDVDTDYYINNQYLFRITATF